MSAVLPKLFTRDPFLFIIYFGNAFLTQFIHLRRGRTWLISPSVFSASTFLRNDTGNVNNPIHAIYGSPFTPNILDWLKSSLRKRLQNTSSVADNCFYFSFLYGCLPTRNQLQPPTEPSTTKTRAFCCRLQSVVAGDSRFPARPSPRLQGVPTARRPKSPNWLQVY